MVGAFVLLSPRGRVTRENYDRVRVGMALAEVDAILGPPHPTALALEDLPVEEFDEGDLITDVLDPHAPIDVERAIPSDVERAIHCREWPGGQGIARVVYWQERVAAKEWLPRLSLVERVQRRWGRWFPK